MKGVIFTLDALFALIVAVASISIMLYFFYTPQVSYSFRYGEAASILSQLEGTNLAYLAQSNRLANQMLALSNTQAAFWPMLHSNNANNAGADFGPAYPFISFIFTAPSNIQTGIVAGYGNIYFGSGSSLFAVNATTGLKAWSKNVQTNVQSTPVIYYNMLVYANATNITAVNAVNGNLVWSANIVAIAGSQVQITSPFIIYDNKLIFGASNFYAYALYLSNGSTAWSINIGQSPTSFASTSGSLAFKTSSNYIGTIVFSGGAAQLLYPLKASASVSPIVSLGDIFYYGSSSNADASYINGTQLFSTSAGSKVTGVDIYDNLVIYQGTKSILATTPSGMQLWSEPISYGPAPINASPVVGGGMVYAVWAGNLTAQSLKNGSVMWYYQLPPPLTFSPYLAIAYGKLFAITGNKVIAFGSCNIQNVNANSSILYTIASLYVNRQTGCAEELASSVYPMYNYTIVVSGKGMNASGVLSATYYGNTYTYIQNPSLDTPSYSWSFWIYPYSWSPNNGIIGQNSLGSGFPYIYQSSNTSSSQVLIFTNNVSAQNSRVGTKISLDNWYHIVAEYSQPSNTLYLYVNGTLVGSKKEAAPVAHGISPFYIGYLPFGSATFNGLISNVQIYNNALSPQQVGLLYLSGPSGSPILNGLIAWYPDGCANDVYALNNTGYIGASCQSLLKSAPLPPKFYNAHVASKISVPMQIYNWFLNSSYIYNVSVISWQ